MAGISAAGGDTLEIVRIRSSDGGSSARSTSAFATRRSSRCSGLTRESNVLSLRGTVAPTLLPLMAVILASLAIVVTAAFVGTTAVSRFSLVVGQSGGRYSDEGT